jgi:sugar lactone lactonase YvrE
MTGTNPSVQLEIFSDHLFVHAEGPLWDHRRQSFCCVDIESMEIHEFTKNGAHHIHQLTEQVGTIAIRDDGDFVAALQSGFAFVNRHTGDVTPIADPENHLPGNRFNDGKCDPAGRFVAGTMSLSDEEEKGGLYALNAKGQVHQLLNRISLSNGIAWSADNATMYLIDTPTRKVFEYPYRLGAESLTNGKVIIDVPEEQGFPDGMTIDTEGMLWIAHFGGGRVTRWDPKSGTCLLTITIDAKQVTSCCFGGEHFEDLYITTSRVGLSQDERAAQPQSGKIFVWRNCGYKGLPFFEFKTTAL